MSLGSLPVHGHDIYIFSKAVCFVDEIKSLSVMNVLPFFFSLWLSKEESKLGVSLSFFCLYFFFLKKAILLPLAGKVDSPFYLSPFCM
jgi:hypothetical protein